MVENVQALIPRMFAAWRAEVDSVPIPELITPDVAAAVLAAARTRPRAACPARGQVVRGVASGDAGEKTPAACERRTARRPPICQGLPRRDRAGGRTGQHRD